MRTRACRILAVLLLGALPLRLPAAPAGAADPGLPFPAADLAARAKADPRVREYVSVFGAPGVVPASLDLIRDETRLPGWMNGISHSLCHGWASGPTAWMSEHVLGVKVLEPGCAAVRIAPQLDDLQWAEGTFPTPKGVIKLRHEKGADGKVQSKVEAPEGVRIER